MGNGRSRIDKDPHPVPNQGPGNSRSITPSQGPGNSERVASSLEQSNDQEAAPSRGPHQINPRAPNLHGQRHPNHSDPNSINIIDSMTWSVVAESALSNSASVCHRFLENRCPYDALSCPYSHKKDDTLLCEAWKHGLCYNNRCLGRHYYLEKDSVPTGPKPPQEMIATAAYSSPLVVKVKSFEEKHRREEVDVETGRRRSWIETENKEIIDITGVESPVALASKGGPSPAASLTGRVDSEDQNARGEESAKESASYCLVCERKFKGERGVKSHLNHPKSKCGKLLAETQ